MCMRSGFSHDVILDLSERILEMYFFNDDRIFPPLFELRCATPIVGVAFIQPSYLMHFTRYIAEVMIHYRPKKLAPLKACMYLHFLECNVNLPVSWQSI